MFPHFLVSLLTIGHFDHFLPCNRPLFYYQYEKGIIWPTSIAPYKVALIVSNMNDKEASKYASTIYNKLRSLGIDTILDDRYDTVGVKFNDIDLIGVPIRITIGQKFQNGFVEFKLRNEEESTDIELNSILNKVLNEIDNYSV